MERKDIRNIGIIAHVDHGKTTLVNALLKQGGVFRENQAVEDCVMDNNPLEKERGITILAKNTSCMYKGVKINIVDTPGHIDFSGEVERIMKMIDGAILVVDSYEGPMPQTRFVLKKAIEMDLPIIICINKIDKPEARPEEVLEEIYNLLMDLEGGTKQLYSPVIYCSARKGVASKSAYLRGENMTPLFEAILEAVPFPIGDAEGPLQLLISSIEYNDYVGRLGVGRIDSGTLYANKDVVTVDYYSAKRGAGKVSDVYLFSGLEKVKVEKATVGDIVSFSGIENITIGKTICDVSHPLPIETPPISEPTMRMSFRVNDSPFAGKEGQYVTSRHLKARLMKETLRDVSLQVEEASNSEIFRVSGRGEVHFSVLIEKMRRDGYEFQVSKPEIIDKDVDGVKMEPFEQLIIDIPDTCIGRVMESISKRQGDLLSMQTMKSRMRLTFKIPSRGLIGYRSIFLGETSGNGVMNTTFIGFGPAKSKLLERGLGSLIAYEDGETTTYGLHAVQSRGTMFVKPSTQVYAGMIVGVSPKKEDLVVNVCKKKHITNIRAAGSDETLRLNVPKAMSLEEMISFISDDEMIEVTPKSLRMRKKILSHGIRAKKL